MTPKQRLSRIGIYVSAVVLGLFTILPIYWMVLTSLKPTHEITTIIPRFWPSEFQWERYADVITGDFGRPLMNSLIVAGGTVVGALLIAAFAAYTLARFNLPFRKYLLILVLSVQMFPPIVLLIPLFSVMLSLGLINNYIGLIIAYLAFTLPLVIYMLRGFMASIPAELEDAAMVDGATRMTAIMRIVMPLTAPGLAATAVFAFLVAWNEFLFALVFMTTGDMHTLPVALSRFRGRGFTDWGMVMTASTVFTIPVILFFLAVQRRMTTGLVMGATKG